LDDYQDELRRLGYWIVCENFYRQAVNRRLAEYVATCRREGKEALMRIGVQVVIESYQETTPLHVEEVVCFNRGELTPETLGLRLDEAKQILAGVQQAVMAQQVEDYVEHQR
jgi:hypothetical protein